MILPATPFKVRLDDLTEDGKLLTNEQLVPIISGIEHIKTVSAKKFKKTTFAQRFKKNELNSPYDILAFGEDYYAIYYGLKKNTHMGMGGFGYVKLAQNVRTGVWVVLKLTVADKEKNEYHLLQKVEFALGYLERTVTKENSFIELQKKHNRIGSATSWSSRQANLLMELAEGISLAHLHENKYVLPAHKWIEIILKVLIEYKKLKDKNVLHKDLKLDNIYYSFSKNKATIIDYGGSRTKGFLSIHKKEKVIYTKGYAAPEVVKKKYSEASDIYALGATFFYLLDLNDPTQSAIKDPELYATLHSYCLSCMANEKKKKRPTTEDAILYFEKVQQSHSNLLPKPLRTIGLFSVEEYLQHTHDEKMVEEVKLPIQANTLEEKHDDIPNNEGFYLANFVSYAYQFIKSYVYPAAQKEKNHTEEQVIEEINTPIQPLEVKKRYDQAFISALTLFDEVWLIDSSERTKKEYIQLCRELEDQKIVVGQRCFIANSSNLNQIIPLILEKQKLENSAKGVKYFCITAQKEIQLSSPVCTIILNPEEDQSYYQKIIESYTALEIQEEYKNIKSSLSQLAEQHPYIKETIHDFDRHFAEGTLSLDHIKSRFYLLKKALSSADQESSLNSPSHFHLGFFSKLPPAKSSSQLIVQQIESHLDEWVASFHR